jgi:DNA (cytosine-5)-methyltransferase 1
MVEFQSKLFQKPASGELAKSLDANNVRPALNDQFPIISLFSGAGGLDLSFKQAGYFKNILSVDCEPVFCRTLHQNKSKISPTGEILCETIISANQQISECIEGLGGAPFGMIGGPPCESFSTMGKRKGFVDARGGLIKEFADLIVKHKPKFFLIENVPAILSEKQGHKEHFLNIVQYLKNNNYSITYDILCAADFGAATSRKRMICVGFDGLSNFNFPRPTHQKSFQLALGDGREPWVGSWTVLKDLPSPGSAAGNNIQAHIPVKHTAAVVERFRQLSPGGYDYGRKRPRLHPDEPCKSLVAGNFGGTRNPIHPLEPRELTNREIARIQGFPDDYHFVGTFAEVGKQIANAVPIPLGTAVANQICKHLASTSDV